MKHLYIFNNNSNAAAYGIGTYIRQLVECLKDNNHIKLTMIELGSREKELKIDNDETNRVRKISIPDVQYSWNNNNQKRYYRNIVYLLYPYITNSDENIFHLNQLYAPSFVKMFLDFYSER